MPGTITSSMKRPSPRRNRGSSRRFTAAPKNFAPMARPTGDYTPPSQRWNHEGVMPKLRVHSFAMSIDGYGAGPNQDLENPLGVRGPELMEWFFPTRLWQKMHGNADGETGVDNGIAEQGFVGIGAWILGRNMFGPVRGPWPDDSWKGWWGDEP